MPKRRLCRMLSKDIDELMHSVQAMEVTDWQYLGYRLAISRLRCTKVLDQTPQMPSAA